MARARLLKPGFFTNEELSTIPMLGRLLFAGLWCLADREGRLEDRPGRIRAELFPYDPIAPAEINGLLGELETLGFIFRYEIEGKSYIQIGAFAQHQKPHMREAASVIPPPPAWAEPEKHDLGSVEADLGSEEEVSSPNEAMPSPAVTGNGSSSVTGDSDGNESSSVTGKWASADADGPEPPAADDDDPEPEAIAEAMTLWTSATGGMLTPMQGAEIVGFLRDYPRQWVLDAIRKTGLANAKTVNYTARILKDWEDRGRDAARPARGQPPPIAAEVFTSLEARKQRYGR